MKTSIFAGREGEAIYAGIAIRGRDDRSLHHEFARNRCRYVAAERDSNADQSPRGRTRVLAMGRAKLFLVQLLRPCAALSASKI